MTRITLYAPERQSQEVTFRWAVDPPTALYRRCQWTLRFPSSVDISGLPVRLWWIVALACLHSHWPLLRPCTVHIPIRLETGELEFWNRLLDAEVATLEAYRGRTDASRTIEIVDAGSPLDPLSLIPDNGRCATAFSGGKDSLLQVGLLTELTHRPILVTVTSPMPPLEDHLTLRRRHVLNEVTVRRPVTLAEVTTDYRACWENEFPRSLGYPIAVNELSDTFVYFAALLAVGVALGAPHLFLASEAEVQENVDVNGRVVQHHHFMYSAVTQRALQVLLGAGGIHYSSLTSPLYSFQVQGLLWTRYRDLRDLQYSCWQVKAHEAMCNRCSQCLRIALCALALGETPAQIGVDLVRLLNAMRRWNPRQLRPDALPADLVSQRLAAQVVRDIRATPLFRVARAIADPPSRLLTPRAGSALVSYAALRRRAAAYDVGAAPGYRRGFIRLLDPLLRQSAARIFAQYFDEEEGEAYAAVLSRGDALTKWITEPIGGEREKTVVRE